MTGKSQLKQRIFMSTIHTYYKIVSVYGKICIYTLPFDNTDDELLGFEAVILLCFKLSSIFNVRFVFSIWNCSVWFMVNGFNLLKVSMMVVVCSRIAGFKVGKLSVLFNLRLVLNSSVRFEVNDLDL
jgi:hypothetical protein